MSESYQTKKKKKTFILKSFKIIFNLLVVDLKKAEFINCEKYSLTNK
jgi:hypothetical protein